MFFKKSPKWLIVFLGNPGTRYESTRHNVGFMVADVIEKNEKIRIKRIKYGALTAGGNLGGIPVFLMKPQTYMNLSGEAVKPAADFYKISPQNIIAIADDVSLEPGKLRIRRRGSDGGHRGLRSIIAKLGSDEFIRIKIGIGSPDHPDYDMADWVTGKPGGDDRIKIEEAAINAAAAINLIIREGIDSAMNKYN